MVLKLPREAIGRDTGKAGEERGSCDALQGRFLRRQMMGEEPNKR
jgi:hypothetical protein